MYSGRSRGKGRILSTEIKNNILHFFSLLCEIDLEFNESREDNTYILLDISTHGQ